VAAARWYPKDIGGSLQKHQISAPKITAAASSTQGSFSKCVLVCPVLKGINWQFQEGFVSDMAPEWIIELLPLTLNPGCHYL
jgi:hypothetical protein